MEVKIKDLVFRKVIDNKEIQEANVKIAKTLNEKLNNSDEVVAVALMNGAYVFAADITRLVTRPLDVYFIKATSYVKTESTGKLNYQQPMKEIEKIVKGKRVIVLDDIADTGLTLTTVSNDFKKMGAKDVYPIAMFYKESIYNKRENVKLFEYGISIPPDFVVGYGLDYENMGRNLPDLYKKVD